MSLGTLYVRSGGSSIKMKSEYGAITDAV